MVINWVLRSSRSAKTVKDLKVALRRFTSYRLERLWRPSAIPLGGRLSESHPCDAMYIDMEELGRELKHLGKAANGIKRELRKAVAESGESVTRAVKAEASWSTGTKRPDGKDGKKSGRTSIPAATSLGMSFTARGAGVVVKVNARKAPHARPLEFGNKGGGGGPTFRHPLFHSAKTKGPWVVQPTRPFFFPVAKAMTPLIEAKIQAAIDSVAIEAGFKGR